MDKAWESLGRALPDPYLTRTWAVPEPYLRLESPGDYSIVLRSSFVHPSFILRPSFVFCSINGSRKQELKGGFNSSDVNIQQHPNILTVILHSLFRTLVLYPYLSDNVLIPTGYQDGFTLQKMTGDKISYWSLLALIPSVIYQLSSANLITTWYSGIPGSYRTYSYVTLMFLPGLAILPLYSL